MVETYIYICEGNMSNLWVSNTFSKVKNVCVAQASNIWPDSCSLSILSNNKGLINGNAVIDLGETICITISTIQYSITI